MFRSHVMVCGGTGCTSSGSDKIAKAFEDEILATGLEMKSRSSARAASACARWAPFARHLSRGQLLQHGQGRGR